MKTKTLLLLCLLTGITLTELSAQNGKNGTGTVPFVETIVGNPFDLSVMCGGQEVDILNFAPSFDLRLRFHYQSGEEIWYKCLLNNTTFTSKKTPEIFNGQTTEISLAKGFYVWHLNLNGNMGHHYIIKMVFDTTTWDMVSYHSVCN